jgi:putative tryptophan/tyrosine transport system substrate-binding protein
MIPRREFIALLGGAATALPLAARAQQPERIRRIGVLASFLADDSETRTWVKSLVQGLRELGWTDGQNIRIDDRWAGDERSRLLAFANELVELKSELIVACGGPAAAALQGATRSLPIVFVQVVDPVAFGLVASLSHPGGNITGFMHFERSMVGKWVDVLKEAVPSITRAAVIFDPNNPGSNVYLPAIETVSRSIAVQLTPTGVRDAAEIKHAIEAFAREPNGALIVLPNPVTLAHRELTIALAASHRLPAMYPYRSYPDSGGLMSYGVDLKDMYRRAAVYVDRILKGDRPADLPVQAPTKFELIVNLKTAKAMGLAIAESFLLRADEVVD